MCQLLSIKVSSISLLSVCCAVEINRDSRWQFQGQQVTAVQDIIYYKVHFTVHHCKLHHVVYHLVEFLVEFAMAKSTGNRSGSLSKPGIRSPSKGAKCDSRGGGQISRAPPFGWSCALN